VAAASSPDLLEARVQVDPAVNVGWLGKRANGVTERYAALRARSGRCAEAMASCLPPASSLLGLGDVVSRGMKWAKRLLLAHHPAEKGGEVSPVVVARTTDISPFDAVTEAVVNTRMTLELFDTPPENDEGGEGVEPLFGVVTDVLSVSRLPPQFRIALQSLVAASMKEPGRASQICECFEKELRGLLGQAAGE
jgi:hypothetical protein